MSTDAILVSLLVSGATAWLLHRAWRRARGRYRASSCCGEGCGCVKPLVFGPKKQPRNGKQKPDTKPE